jgi:16S rRNA processing protein RimM
VTDQLLAIGRVSRAHGIRGEVLVHPLSEVDARFEPDATLRLEDGRSLSVEAARPHQGRLLVKFREVPDRTSAEALRGEVLLIPATESPDLADDDRFWIHQIVGLDVVTDTGRRLGRIAEVRSNPANDLWVTEDGTMVPAIRDVVRNVDVDAGVVTIHELPGLFEQG